jgi:hypothetical protein
MEAPTTRTLPGRSSLHSVGPRRRRDRVQRVLHAPPHPYPWMSAQEQRTEIPKLGRGHPDHRKAILDQQRQQEMRMASIVFRPTRFGLADAADDPPGP